MKLTIVLTVYNKEPYLRRALDALLLQEGVRDDEYEVLAVNDGSTDGSITILDEYAAKNKRIRILTQKNQGLSMARNNGTEEAKGEYVWYVDADDIISKDAVFNVLEACKKTPDVITIQSRYEDTGIVANEIDITADTGSRVLRSRWQDCGVYYILKRSFVLYNGLEFFPNIYHEDDEFTPRMLYLAKTVVVIPRVLYHIYREPNSITQKPRAKRAFDYLIVADHLYSFVVQHDLMKTTEGSIILSHASICINNSLSIICQNMKEEQKRFDNDFYNNRKTLLSVLRASSPIKYKLEAMIFGLFPGKYVLGYKILRIFSKR